MNARKQTFALWTVKTNWDSNHSKRRSVNRFSSLLLNLSSRKRKLAQTSRLVVCDDIPKSLRRSKIYWKILDALLEGLRQGSASVFLNNADYNRYNSQYSTPRNILFLQRAHFVKISINETLSILRVVRSRVKTAFFLLLQPRSSSHFSFAGLLFTLNDCSTFTLIHRVRTTL